MKTRLEAAPWYKGKITQEAAEAVAIISDDIWKEASILFSAERSACINMGITAPKGMQRFLNQVLDNRFVEKGWVGGAGYYVKNKTWVRVTFRHQMSLGSDILDAIKVCKKDGIEMAVILAASRNTLKVISPNDGPAMVSFEKLERELYDMDGAIDIPLVIGELTPYTSASSDVDKILRKSRSRDITIPANTKGNKHGGKSH